MYESASSYLLQLLHWPMAAPEDESVMRFGRCYVIRQMGGPCASTLASNLDFEYPRSSFANLLSTTNPHPSTHSRCESTQSFKMAGLKHFSE